MLDSPLPEAELAADLAAAIEEEFGFAVPVVVRTGAELAAVVAGDPFADGGHRPGAVPGHVPARAARPGAVAPCRRPRAPATTWSRGASCTCGCPTVSSRRRWPPGSGTSCSASPGTARNWNTVAKLAELAR